MTDHCTGPTLAISDCRDTLEVEYKLLLLEEKYSHKYIELSLEKLPTMFLII